MFFCWFHVFIFFFFFFQAEDGIRDWSVTGVQTCALPISAASAAAVAGILFGDFDPHRADAKVFEILAQEIPTTSVAKGALTLADAVVQAGLATSKSEARRGIEQGGIYVNQQRASDIGESDWIGGRHVLLRKGKKDYALLRREG